MSAPESAARRASTLPHGMAMWFRACIGSPCQGPGPLLSLYLPSSAFDFFFLGFESTQLAQRVQLERA